MYIVRISHDGKSSAGTAGDFRAALDQAMTDAGLTLGDADPLINATVDLAERLELVEGYIAAAREDVSRVARQVQSLVGTKEVV